MTQKPFFPLFQVLNSPSNHLTQSYQRAPQFCYNALEDWTTQHKVQQKKAKQPRMFGGEGQMAKISASLATHFVHSCSMARYTSGPSTEIADSPGPTSVYWASTVSVLYLVALHVSQSQTVQKLTKTRTKSTCIQVRLPTSGVSPAWCQPHHCVTIYNGSRMIRHCIWILPEWHSCSQALWRLMRSYLPTGGHISATSHREHTTNSVARPIWTLGHHQGFRRVLHPQHLLLCLCHRRWRMVTLLHWTVWQMAIRNRLYAGSRTGRKLIWSKLCVDNLLFNFPKA